MTKLRHAPSKAGVNPTAPIQRDTLAPAGPAWAGSLMGTSILATLAHTHGLRTVDGLLLGVAAGILVFITVGWIRFRNPPFAAHLMAPWGMVSMGILAFGAAATAVTGNHVWQLICWWIGGPLSVVVSLNQLRGFRGAPTFQWGLALVSPMVAATSGAQLSEVHDGSPHGFYHLVAQVCFFWALCTAVPIFTRCYGELARGRMQLPESIAGTAWIPLGVVGQSTAAAQLLFPARVATVYGAVVLSLGVALAAIACRRFALAVIHWAGYSPGWWGSTFPVGTLCLGTHLLSATTGLPWLDGISKGLLALLTLHWLICVTRCAWWGLSRTAGTLPGSKKCPR